LLTYIGNTPDIYYSMINVRKRFVIYEEIPFFHHFIFRNNEIIDFI